MGDRKCKFCGKQRASGELFHKFPVHNPDLVRKWIINAKLPAEFVPTINDILCADHFARSSYRTGSSKRLWDDAVPTLFVFPESSPYYQKITERKPPTIIIDELKEKDLLAPSVADALAENFSGLTGELISNHFNNMNRKATGVRYTMM